MICQNGLKSVCPAHMRIQREMKIWKLNVGAEMDVILSRQKADQYTRVNNQIRI